MLSCTRVRQICPPGEYKPDQRLMIPRPPSNLVWKGVPTGNYVYLYDIAYIETRKHMSNSRQLQVPVNFEDWTLEHSSLNILRQYPKFQAYEE